MKIGHSVPLIYSTRRQRRLELEKWAASATAVAGRTFLLNITSSEYMLKHVAICTDKTEERISNFVQLSKLLF